MEQKTIQEASSEELGLELANQVRIRDRANLIMSEILAELQKRIGDKNGGN